MTERISITMPDHVAKKLNNWINTYPSDKKKNISKYISDLIERHTPEIMID